MLLREAQRAKNRSKHGRRTAQACQLRSPVPLMKFQNYQFTSGWHSLANSSSA
jgi:hypothetical protein